MIYVGVFKLPCWSAGILLFDRHALDLKGLLKVPSLVASVVGIALFAARGVAASTLLSVATIPLMLLILL